MAVAPSSGYKEEDEEEKAPKKGKKKPTEDPAESDSGDEGDGDSDDEGGDGGAGGAAASDSLEKKEMAIYKDMVDQVLRLRGFPTQHVEKGDRKCNTCQRVFKKGNQLRNHIAKVHMGKGRVACNDDNCSKTFTSKKAMEAHFAKEHEGKGFTCDVQGCGKVFTTDKGKAAHQKTHDAGPPTLKCDFCDGMWKIEKNLKEHMKACPENPDQDKIPCPYCPKIFHMRKLLNRHLQSVHKQKRRR